MVNEDQVEFRVWAPRASSVTLRVGSQDARLEDAGFGIHEAVIPAHAGDDYVFVLDGSELPDPCSRFQPQGLRGPSGVVAPAPQIPLRDPPSLDELVIYEL